MHNRDELAGTFTLDRRPLMQAVLPPNFNSKTMILHPALTEAQEWQVRADLARMDIRREAWMLEADK